jgi:hypothetical protein
MAAQVDSPAHQALTGLSPWLHYEAAEDSGHNLSRPLPFGEGRQVASAVASGVPLRHSRSDCYDGQIVELDGGDVTEIETALRTFKSAFSQP